MYTISSAGKEEGWATVDTVTPGPLTKGALERKNSAKWAVAKEDSEGERPSGTGITRGRHISFSPCCYHT